MPTILFTDIEGSTRLWEELPDAMALALARHDAILGDAIRHGEGEILKTTGDGFIGIFASPIRGAQTAFRIQEALDAETWDATGPIRVRIGVHMGETERRNNDLFGPAMNRAARIMAAGHGGQVLLSAAVAGAVEKDLPAGASLLDLGPHRLKDLTQPEHLYQLSATGLRSQFPALRTLDARPNNLPRQATEFLGRTAELSAIEDIVASESTRLVTITGPGGVGKTRLSLQVAADLSDLFKDGVFFVDLSSERTPAAVFEAIVRALEVPGSGSGDALETLKVRLRDWHALLVLDNFEQVVAAAAGVADLLQAVAYLKVIVTSREALRVRAERVFTVPPLLLASLSAPPDVIAGSEAVRFFAERARAVRPDFEVTEANVPVVAEICQQLDGLPLAIELAAARLNLFTPASLLARLQERLSVLGAGGRDLPERQRTLWGAIEWSYELLDTTERDVFGVMSVFASASLDALESVVKASVGVDFALDVVASLVDKSLVQAREDRGVQRFSMLRMVNEYASERLATTPALQIEIREAHALYFSEFALRLKETVRDANQASALAELEAELGNLRAAWQFWVDRQEVEHLFDMIDALWALHEARGWYSAAIELTREAIDVLEKSGRAPEFVAEELTLRTSLARALMAIHGYNTDVEREFVRVIELAKESGSSSREFPALRALASYYIQRTSWEASVAIGNRLIELATETNNQLMLAEGHYVIAASILFSDPQSALSHMAQASSLFSDHAPSSDRFRSGPNSAVVARTAYAFLLWQSGSLDQGIARIRESLEVARAISHPYSVAYALYHNGFFAINRGRPADCVEYSRELAQVSADNEYPLWATLARLLEGIVLSASGDAGAGLEMTEAAVDLYQGLGPPPVFWPFILQVRAAVHAMAGKATEAVQLLDQAISAVGSLHVDSPGLMVMRADILASIPGSDPAEMEQSYLAAVKAGEAGGLKYEVLTAWIGIVRLRRSLGRLPDGSEELAAVYASISEGHDERYMVAARDLLFESANQPTAIPT